MGIEKCEENYGKTEKKCKKTYEKCVQASAWVTLDSNSLIKNNKESKFVRSNQVFKHSPQMMKLATSYVVKVGTNLHRHCRIHATNKTIQDHNL